MITLLVVNQLLLPLKFSFELLVGDVVHRQVVHVRLDELKSLILDHTSRLAVNHTTQLLYHFSADALPLLARLIESMANNLLHVVQSLDALTQPQGEVSKPLVV